MDADDHGVEPAGLDVAGREQPPLHARSEAGRSLHGRRGRQRGRYDDACREGRGDDQGHRKEKAPETFKANGIGEGQPDTVAVVPPGSTPKVIILGSGPNRIGQGIEFDYCCVHACMALRDLGYETIMVNCNPETVSTDYDTSDRLYFEPLTLEDVLEVVHAERQSGPLEGVIVQLGGQTPLGLARALEAAGVPVVGTSPEAIHLAEDRGAFGEGLRKAGLPAPAFGMATSFEPGGC